MSSCNIRKGKSTDLPLIEEGYSAIFKFDYIDNISIDNKDEILEVMYSYAELDLTNHGIDFLVAEVDSNAVGFISFCKNETKSSIQGLYIKEQFRKQGIAKVLIEEAIKNLTSCHSIKVVASKVNSEAINLYESQGFKEVGVKYTCQI